MPRPAGRARGVAPRPRPAHRSARWLLAAGAVVTTLAVVEIVLRLAGLPRTYRPRSRPPQFAFLDAYDDGVPVYVNVPSQTIRFVYDGDPRGYFGPGNAVDHVTNRLGFRGPEFPIVVGDAGPTSDKPPGTMRLVFLGDSFTFGEGVRFEDTYPQVTARLLAESHGGGGRRFESYDFGVGGYDTRQELYALLNLGALALAPDVVVVGYVLNDAEPPLFVRDPATGEPARRAAPLEEEVFAPAPADDAWDALRIVRLVRHVVRDRAVSARTIEHYRALYAPGSRGWDEARTALRRIVEVCRERGIRCYVVVFPLLCDLGASYPFADAHALVRGAVEAAGGRAIDLLPHLRGADARTLWVHPTDQHPNERVHAIAARALVDALAADGVGPASR